MYFPRKEMYICVLVPRAVRRNEILPVEWEQLEKYVLTEWCRVPKKFFTAILLFIF